MCSKSKPSWRILTFTTVERGVKFMSKPLMFCKFQVVQNLCFDVLFKREETQKVCTARVPGRDLEGPGCPQLQAQGHSFNAVTFAQGSAATEQKRDQKHLSLISFSQTKSSLAVKSQALTAPHGSCTPGLTPVPAIPCSSPPCLGDSPTSGGLGKGQEAPAGSGPSCRSTTEQSSPLHRAGSGRSRDLPPLLPSAAPGPGLLPSMPASPGSSRRLSPPPRAAQSCQKGQAPLHPLLTPLCPASPPLLLPWGVSQQLSN